MYKSVVYKGDKPLGEVDIDPQNEDIVRYMEFRISHFSPPSKRCVPLAVLHTITPSGVCFKMESNSPFQDSPLNLLHSSCIREKKTAVMPLGGRELHLVAMHSRKNDGQCPCFWGFNVASGLYDSCLAMLNLRCLGIVFDLDETLLVANTIRSFEDRIDALRRKINSERDSQRVSCMLSQIKRYQDDKNILTQYAENDRIVDNGKVIKSLHEVVSALYGNHQPIVRPLIRLQEKNIILTRINPQNRDTSVLVRLRPAWEHLKSYLISRGRKRFEVYVCTMAEREYALEMWRLLDPESKLIDTKELLDRIVCVKAGLKKSLFNVFQDGICHPSMALVIDDRLKVWDEKDQPRVHVVPAFAPYYAPQAEVNNALPVLFVARSVACTVRGGFFKEFDEGMLQRIPQIEYEDDIKNIPSPPDVSNYLILEDDASFLNGNKNPLCFDGMADVEVERRLKDAISDSSTVSSTTMEIDLRLVPPLQYKVAPSSIPSKKLPVVASVVKPLSQIGLLETCLQSSAREEGELLESELDPDRRRRLLILQHGQDTRDHASGELQFPITPSPQIPVPVSQSRGCWIPVKEEMSPRLLAQAVPSKEIHLQSESVHVDKHLFRRPPFLHTEESSLPSDRLLQRRTLPEAALRRDERLRLNHSLSSYPSISGKEVSLGRSPCSNRDLDVENGRVNTYDETPVGALQDIASKWGTKVEFRSALVSSTELQFRVEVWFAGEKIGEGIGRTRRESKRQAAMGSLMELAEKYISLHKPDSSFVRGDRKRFPSINDNGFPSDVKSLMYQPSPKDSLTLLSASKPNPRVEGSMKLKGSRSSLKEQAEID